MTPTNSEPDGFISLSAAAKLAGVSRTAIVKACGRGDLLRERSNRGRWVVRHADVLRAFPPKPSRPVSEATDRNRDDTELARELGRLEERLSQSEARREEERAQHARLAESLEADRTAWRSQAEALVARLTESQEHARALEADRDLWRAYALRPWWRRVFGIA